MDILLGIMLFGACQGYGLCILLWIKYHRIGVKNYNFLFVLISISSFLILHYLYFNGIVNSHRLIISLVTMTLIFTIYFYVRFLNSNGIKDRWNWNLIILSSLLIFVITYFILIVSLRDSMSTHRHLEAIYFEVIQGVILVQYITFILRSYPLVCQLPKTHHIKMIHGFFALLSIGWTSVLVFQYTDLNFENDYLYAIYFQIIPFLGIYLIGYYLIFDRDLIKTIEKNPLAVVVNDQARVLKKIVSENKLFLNQDLTLDGLASSCNMSSRATSKLLKEEFKMGFYEFINYYRLDYFLSEVEHHPHLKHEAIAISCGFKNKVTFYKAFKRGFGISPKQFLSL